jgi:hypothetical protein
MGRPAHKTFSYAGNQYHVRTMPPRQAHAFGMEMMTTLVPVVSELIEAGRTRDAAKALAAIGSKALDSTKLGAIFQEVWQWTILPNNREASNEVEFNSWFDDHMPDLFPVSVLALWSLISDFTPPSLRTSIDAAISNAGKASPLTSQTGSEPPPSSPESASPA